VPCNQAAILYSKCQFLSNSSSVHPSWSRRSSFSLNLHPSTKMIVSTSSSSSLQYAQHKWERWPTFYLHVGPWSSRSTPRDQGWMNTKRVREELALRACSPLGGGPQVSEVPHLGEVTKLFIQSLFFSWLRSHARWGSPPRRVTRLARPGNPPSWGEFSPCESGVTRLAGVIKSKLRKARQKNMAADHYQPGEFFRRHSTTRKPWTWQCPRHFGNR